MAENTKIEWCDHTWNPWRGCQHAVLPDGTPHPGCANCYAEAMSKRNPATLGQWGEGGTRIVAADKTFEAPLEWNKRARQRGERQRVFVDSLSDFFEDWQGVLLDSKGRTVGAHSDGCIFPPDQRPARNATMADVRRRVFAIIDRCDWLDFLILTKRPQNIRGMWQSRCHRCDGDPRCDECRGMGMHRPNVHLLYSASDQPSLDAGIAHLLACRPLVPVLGLSLEPLTGPISIANALKCAAIEYEGESIAMWPLPMPIDGVIVGGESGPHARPMHPDWARSLRDQCQAAGTAFFFKQWGEWEPAHHYWSSQADGETVMAELVSLRSQYQLAFGGDGGLDDLWRHRDTVMVRAGKKAAGRELDWREWNDLPERREVPA